MQSSSEQSSSQHPSIAQTLVVISSDDDTENQSVASRTRFQRARQRTPAIAPPIENITNDPPPTSQPTDNNPLTNLQDRQRAPQQQLSRCLEDGTRIDLSLSEISDEEVDYGSSASTANSDTAPNIYLFSKMSKCVCFILDLLTRGGHRVPRPTPSRGKYVPIRGS